MIHNNEIVSIEEVLIKSPQPLPAHHHHQLTRKFIFTNRSTNLKLRITGLNASVDSCEINDHQIIVPKNEENNRESSWCPHVITLAPALVLEEATQKIISYHLTKDNELIVEGRGFNSILQNCLMNPCFFNLNSVIDKPTLEGHYLHIRASHQEINVYTDSNSVFSQFINGVPLLIADYLDGSEFVCSASPVANLQNSSIVASLNYGGKSVDIYLEIEQWTAAHLLVQIRDGSIAFIPHNMSRFKVTYKFSW